MVIDLASGIVGGAVIVGIITGYATLKAKVDQHDKDIHGNGEKGIKENISLMQIDITEIKTGIGFINQNIMEIKDKK